MTITEFLEARIAEDEQVARNRPNSAQIHYSGCYYYNYSLDAGWECDCDEDGDGTRRLLAECAAKRAIIEAHPVTVQLWWEEQCEIEVCETCQEDSYPDRWPCPTIQAIAAVYAAHPDCRQEWVL